MRAQQGAVIATVAKRSCGPAKPEQRMVAIPIAQLGVELASAFVAKQPSGIGDPRDRGIAVGIAGSRRVRRPLFRNAIVARWRGSAELNSEQLMAQLTEGSIRGLSSDGSYHWLIDVKMAGDARAGGRRAPRARFSALASRW